MGKAGQALQETLKRHDISQSRLAKELGVDRPIVFRWFHGRTDPNYYCRRPKMFSIGKPSSGNR